MNKLKELRAKLAEGTISDEEKVELETLEAEEAEKGEDEVEEVEIDEKSINAIAKKVGEEIKANEKTVKKDISIAGGAKAGEVSKEVKTLRWLKALQVGDFATLKAMNEGTPANGGDLVPPTDFIAEVLRLEPTYGVAARNARIRRTDRTSVTVNKKNGGIAVVETGELVAKTETEMTFLQVEIDLKKYAGITILSDELVEDAAVDIFNELTRDYAMAFGKKQDELCFTDPTTGILKIAGTNSVVTGATFDGITFDALNKAIYAVPVTAMKSGKFYFNPTILGAIQRIKDKDDNYIWKPGPNGVADGTIWGYPYELVEVMPAVSETALNTPFIIFGDMSEYLLAIRNSMTLDILKEGTVGSVNLGEQDAKALRGVQRFGAGVIFANAFSVIKTAASS